MLCNWTRAMIITSKIRKNVARDRYLSTLKPH
jgi:hypothetical protein